MLVSTCFVTQNEMARAITFLYLRLGQGMLNSISMEIMPINDAGKSGSSIIE